jgi:hypothetical protein
VVAGDDDALAGIVACPCLGGACDAADGTRNDARVLGEVFVGADVEHHRGFWSADQTRELRNGDLVGRRHTSSWCA